MKVLNFSLIQIGELPEADPATERMVEQVNLHFDDTKTALQGNLTMADNLNAEIRRLKVAQDTAISVRLQTLSGKPIHALLLATSVFDYARFAWRVLDESLVEIKVKFDTAPAADADIVVAFLGS